MWFDLAYDFSGISPQPLTQGIPVFLRPDRGHVKDVFSPDIQGAALEYAQYTCMELYSLYISIINSINLSIRISRDIFA